MLLAVDTPNHTIDYHCTHCGNAHRGHPIVARGPHMEVRSGDIVLHCLTCADAAAKGAACAACEEVHGPSVEVFNFDRFTDVDAGLAQHPKSLVGFKFADTGNIVTEDTRYGGSPERQAQVRLILSLQRHPQVVSAREKAQATTE